MHFHPTQDERKTRRARMRKRTTPLHVAAAGLLIFELALSITVMVIR